MSFLSKFNFKKKSAVPLSIVINSQISSPLVTKTDAADFYSSWVYACIDRRAKGLANIQPKLYRLKKGGDVEEVFEHELLDLLYRINPEMTKFDFFQLSSIYLDLFGASPFVLDGGKKGGQPKNLYLARPEFLKAKRDGRGTILGYEYQIGSQKIEFDKDEVIYIRNYNPKDPSKGLGVIEAVRLTAQADDYIQQHNSKLLENGARPSGFFKISGEVDEKEQKRLKAEIGSQYQGYDNAYKIMLLQGGMDYTPASIPPKDLDFIQSREMNRDEIMSIFGVSKPIMGIFDDINRASAKTAEYLFAKYTLEPRTNQYFEQLNEFLVPRYGDDLWLSFEPLASDDDEAILAEKKEAWNKWKTTNEIRSEEGLSPVAGGDIIYMPLSNMPSMRNEEGKKQHIELEAKDFKVGRVDLKTQSYIKKRILNRNVRIKRLAEKAAAGVANKIQPKNPVVFKIVPEKKEFSLSDEQIDAFYKARMTEESGLEGLWSKRFTEFFEKQQDRFLKAVEGLDKKSDTYGIDAQEELKATIDIISPLMYETMAKASKGAAELIGEPAIIDMDFIKTWIDGVSQKIGELINQVTIDSFAETLKAGIANGESLSELKKRVEEVFTFAKDHRAELIARTETARGVTEAHRKTYEHYGFDEVKWLLAPGSCELCLGKAQGQWSTKTIESEIPVHPACKCDFTPL